MLSAFLLALFLGPRSCAAGKVLECPDLSGYYIFSEKMDIKKKGKLDSISFDQVLTTKPDNKALEKCTYRLFAIFKKGKYFQPEKVEKFALVGDKLTFKIADLGLSFVGNLENVMKPSEPFFWNGKVVGKGMFLIGKSKHKVSLTFSNGDD